MKIFLHLAILLFTVGTWAAVAQDVRATITGTLRDPSAAGIPQADVTVRNVETNVRATVKTNDQGYYEVPFLAPGKYRVEAKAEGFKQFMREGIELQTRQRAVVDVVMQMGAVAETITVKEQVSLLDTATASAGLLLETKRILDLPVVSNNIFLSTTLAPGVTNDQGTYGARLTDKNNYAPRVGGGGAFTSEFTLDGFTSTVAGNRPGFVPPLLAVQEFKIETTPFDASLGGGTGGYFTAATKAGTNEYHGALYWNHSQTRWNATRWNTNRAFYQDVAAGRKKPTDQKQLPGRTNDFGFTLGGPLEIPIYKDGTVKRISGKDKLFFFFNYHGNRSGGPGAKFYRMPTDLEKQGTFSELLARGGSQFQIYDPLSGKTVANKVVRTPFAGNIIPAARLSPIAKAYLHYWPSPNNVEGSAFDFSNNYFSYTQPAVNQLDSLINRWDYNVSDRHRAFFRWNHSRYEDLSGDFTGKGLMTKTSSYDNAGILLDWVWTKSSSSVYNFKAGWSKHDDIVIGIGKGIDPATYGYPSYLRDRAGDRPHLPQINLSSVQSLQTGTDAMERYHVYNLAGTGMHVKGNHTLRWGADIRHYQYHDQKPGLSAGSFTFSNAYTKADSGASAPSSGLDFAAFLLGFPNAGSIEKKTFLSVQDNMYGLYFQDDWRVNSKLTVNVGLRYELPTPSTEWHNRIMRPLLMVDLPISAAAKAAYAKAPLSELPASEFKVVGGAQFAGLNGNPRTMYDYDANNWMPRIGLAYRVNSRLVIRGGYAVFSEPNTGSQALRAGTSYGFNQSTKVIPTNDNGATFNATLADPFPNNLEGGARFLEPVGTARGIMQNMGDGYWMYGEDRKSAYSHRFRAGVQYGLGNEWMTEIAYVGSRIKDLNISRNPNAVPGKFWSRTPYRNAALANELNKSVTNPFAGLFPGMSISGNTIQKQQLLRPFPHLTWMTLADDPIATSKYDSIEAQVQKRMSNGYTVQVSYTGSKQFTDKLIDEFETVPTRVLDNWFQRVAINGVWEIPYGRSRRFGSNSHPILQTVLGGWNLAGVYQYQIKGPLKFGNYLFNGDFSEIHIPHGETTPERKFNIDAGFNRVQSQQLAGYSVRINPESPDSRLQEFDPTNQLDLSVVKNFHLTERYYFRLKMDTFNVANHPMFGAPDTSPTSGTFGQIAGFGTRNPMRNYLFTLQFFF